MRQVRVEVNVEASSFRGLGVWGLRVWSLGFMGEGFRRLGFKGLGVRGFWTKGCTGKNKTPDPITGPTYILPLIQSFEDTQLRANRLQQDTSSCYSRGTVAKLDMLLS